MFNTQKLFTAAALAGASMAQSSTSLDCSQSVSYFIANAPTMDPLRRFSDHTAPDTLANPSGYVEVLCGVAAELPPSLLPEFQSYGQALLKYGSSHISEYDAFVTECVTTGPVASATISYLNNLLTGTGLLCQPTATPGASSNGTISTAPFPTATGANSTASSTLDTSIPTAAAAKPTGVLVGAAAMGGLLGAAIML